jgi:hypothetical protein
MVKVSELTQFANRIQTHEREFKNVLRRPGIDSKELIPAAYVAWRGPVHQIRLSYRLPTRHAGNLFLGSLKSLKIRALESRQFSDSGVRMLLFCCQFRYTAINEVVLNICSCFSALRLIHAGRLCCCCKSSVYICIIYASMFSIITSRIPRSVSLHSTRCFLPPSAPA